MQRKACRCGSTSRLICTTFFAVTESETAVPRKGFSGTQVVLLIHVDPDTPFQTRAYSVA